MNQFTIENFCRKLERLLNAPADSVKEQQELKALKSWDSLTVLEFIVMADSDYSSDLQPADIAACKTVYDLARLTFSQSALKAT